MTDKTAPTASSSMGRPREARADRAILSATLELMAEHGVHDLRVDDVADRAGVGKATIYRRYRSKDELVTDAVATLVGEIEIPDTGSTRSDLPRADAPGGRALQRLAGGQADAHRDR